MIKYLDFEKQVENIDSKILELKKIDTEKNVKLINEYNINKKKLFSKIYSNLNAWQKVQIARHSDRPHCKDYIESIFENFVSLAGDKKYGEDAAIISGIGSLMINLI